jgi:small subunit ribosomal protein S6
LQRYDIVAIVLADLNEEDITAFIERIKTIITDRKGVIAKVDKWGKRHLAYEIKKKRDGYYFLIDFAGNGPIVNEIERNCKIDDRVLKFMTVKKEGATTAEGIERSGESGKRSRCIGRRKGHQSDRKSTKRRKALSKENFQQRRNFKEGGIENGNTELGKTKQVSPEEVFSQKKILPLLLGFQYKD